MRGEQQAQCERIESCEADVADHSSELARVDERAKLADERSQTVDTRTRNVQPSLGITLTKSQKSMLASAGLAVIGMLADAVRHGIAFLLAYLQAHPRTP